MRKIVLRNVLLLVVVRIQSTVLYIIALYDIINHSFLPYCLRCDLKSREGISLQPLERLFRYIIPADIPFVLQRAETIDSNIGNSRAGVSHTPAVGYKDEVKKTDCVTLID